MKVRWLKGAVRSLRFLHAHVATDNPQAAQYVARSIHEATGRLAMFPGSGRVGKLLGTRELVISQWPYIVVYRIVGEEVQILRVFHSATGWWHAASTAEPTETDDDA